MKKKEIGRRQKKKKKNNEEKRNSNSSRVDGHGASLKAAVGFNKSVVGDTTYQVHNGFLHI